VEFARERGFYFEACEGEKINSELKESPFARYLTGADVQIANAVYSATQNGSDVAVVSNDRALRETLYDFARRDGSIKLASYARRTHRGECERMR